MLNQDFVSMLKNLHAEELVLHNNKHAQYAAMEEDTLRNFKDGAAALGVSPMMYCLSLLEKHRQALQLNARGETNESMGVIFERVRDIRLYLALFLGLKHDYNQEEMEELEKELGFDG